MKSRFAGLAICAGLVMGGCARSPVADFQSIPDGFHAALTEIEYPDVSSVDVPAPSPSPVAITAENAEYRDMTFFEAVAICLENSQVFRDLGGTIIRVPGAARTTFEPAIQETDPVAGVEAALAAFDASFSASTFFEDNDRRFNNRVFGVSGILRQDLATAQTQISKRAATGSEFSIRQIINFDDNNASTNQFDSSWDAILETEVRQPLLQGAGVEFNRIAGPGNNPANINGVLVARIRTDISLADFEAGVRDLLSNVENAWWDLYYAYGNLHARREARDAALQTWHKYAALARSEKATGDQEAQVREQYFRFDEDVDNALDGRLLQGTRTNNGSSGGTFQATAGVRVAERRLRLLIGLPITDGVLVRPADEPVVAPCSYDWDLLVGEALSRRLELRRQRWLIKSRELELQASRNFLLPELDLVGRYRWRGFGNQLLDVTSRDEPRFDNALRDLTSGDFQEWQLGMEFNLPLGFRRAWSGVRNAELRLARERAVLREQERQVQHDLSNAVADSHRAYRVWQKSYNRLLAARRQLDLLTQLQADDLPVQLDVLMDSQRRFADALSRYYQTQAEYMLAVKNVHFEKGSLIDYFGVHLAEGPWPCQASYDAWRREQLRKPPRAINYATPALTAPMAPPASFDPALPQLGHFSEAAERDAAVEPAAYAAPVELPVLDEVDPVRSPAARTIRFPAAATP